MDILILYVSYHHMNTEKIARAMGSAAGARVKKLTDSRKEEVMEASLTGFGSGVYASRFDRRMVSFIDSLPDMEGKKAFLFSTCGVRKNTVFNRANACFRKKLEQKGFDVLGEFDCPGHDTFGILKIFGGINRGRPGREDLERAAEFAESVRRAA